MTCSVEACEMPVVANGMCGTHYMRDYRATAKTRCPNGRGGLPLVEAWDDAGRAHVAFETARATFCLRRLDTLASTPAQVDRPCARCEAGLRTVTHTRSRGQWSYMTRLSNAAINGNVLGEEGIATVLSLAENGLVVPPAREKRAA